MSKLRKFPTRHTCQAFLGKGHGICGEPAIIRCNACRLYFCEECWQDHLEMSVVTVSRQVEPLKEKQ